MIFGSFDTETVRFAPGWQAPPPVCLSYCVEDALDLMPMHEFDFTALLRSGVTWGGVNIGYDMACALAWGHASAEEIFAAYERDQIIDLSVFERVAEIGGWTTRKELSLAMLSQAYGFGEVEKGDVRTSYGELLGRPLAEYSDEQRLYALKDAVLGRGIFRRQLERWRGKVNLSDVAFLSRKQFWLGLVRAWGIRTDPNSVHILEGELEEHVTELEGIAKQAGFVRPNGKRDMKAIARAVTAAYEGHPPMTAAKRNRKSTKPFVPKVRTDKDTLLAAGDPILETLADYGSWKAIKNGDLLFLQAGAVAPIHTKFGLADTTRSTSSKPNIQNIRRAMKKDCVACGRPAPAYAKVCQCGGKSFKARQGIRECFVPNPGNCFVACDHAGLELATLAQVCVSRLGLWDMAGKLNRGEDLHCHVAAEILHVSYEQAIALKEANDKELKNARNCGKVVNFGAPGGMAAPTLVLYAKQSYGIELEEAFAYELLEHWRHANPDGVAFLRYIRSLQVGHRFDVTIPGTTIQRRQTTYCSAANCHFQGLGAILEAHVGWVLAREMYAGRGVLRFARPVNFVHDEFILECPIGVHTEVAKALQSTMVTEARAYLPDVKIKAEVSAMIRWSKSAEARYDASGNLLIWGLDYE